MARAKKAVPAQAAPEAAPKADAPKTEAKAATVYRLSDPKVEAEHPVKSVRDTSVGGYVMACIATLGANATKAAILEEFKSCEKVEGLRCKEWRETPQKYVNGYVDWLSGNNSIQKA